MKRIVLLILLELGTWSLELASGAPLHPANPYPADLANNVPANADLAWTPGDMELIRNGGFEITNFTGWVRVNQGGGGGGGANNNTYINDGLRRPINGDIPYPPYAGNYCAVTDQDGPGLISMYQDVFVPGGVGSVWLTWADQIHNYYGDFVLDPPQPQLYRVELRATNNSVLTVLYRTEPGDPAWTAWNKRAYDVTPYKGRTLRIAFVQEQWLNFFHMYYDNVSVRVRETGPVTYDVFFGTNSAPGSNEFRGTVSAGAFALPQLLPQTTYFWRVDARIGTNVIAGPVWRFTTAPIGPVDHFTWEPILSTQSPATPFNVAVTARDAFENLVTNFSGTAMVTARTVEATQSHALYNSLSSSAYATFENATVGYSFTPNTDLIVTSFDAAGRRIWTDDGILIGTHPPIHLRAGKTYRLGMYSPGVVTNYMRFDGPSTFPHGTLNQAYEGTGDAFPTRPHPARWWQVSLGYVVTTLSSEEILSQSVPFNSGSWTGAISIPSTGWIQLTASDSNGATGHANLFEVAEQMRLQILKMPLGEVVLRFSSMAGQTYWLETSQDLSTWIPFGSNIQGSGDIIERPVTPNGPAAFFRLAR